MAKTATHITVDGERYDLRDAELAQDVSDLNSAFANMPFPEFYKENFTMNSGAVWRSGYELKNGHRYTFAFNYPATTLTIYNYVGCVTNSGWGGNIQTKAKTGSFTTTADGIFACATVSGGTMTSVCLFDTTDNDALMSFIESRNPTDYDAYLSTIDLQIKNISGAYIAPLFYGEISVPNWGIYSNAGVTLVSGHRYTFASNAAYKNYRIVGCNSGSGFVGTVATFNQTGSFIATSNGYLCIAGRTGGDCVFALFDTTGSDALQWFIENNGLATLKKIYTAGDSESAVYNSPIVGVLFVGDSQTQRGMWATEFNTKYSVNNNAPVDFYGYGGENSTQIAATQGGLGLYVSPFTIPADTSSVAIELHTDITEGSLDLLKQNNQGYTNIEISGVTGTINWTGTSNYFTRAVAGSSVSVDRPQKVQSELYYKRNRVLIVEVGTNDNLSGTAQENVQKLAPTIHDMIRHNGNDTYLVLGLTYHGNCANIEETNRLLAKEFGDHFVDLLKYLLTYGLDDAGITPTASDTSAIAAGHIPPSLLDTNDQVHFNAVCGTVIGDLIYDRGKDMHYWI